jgi:catechol 2,3-dioxygenase-like lactoylglutathione lyase family enzyme
MFVPSLSFVLLFVTSPSKSALFYRRILGLEPVEESPTFALFALPGGVMLGLWSRATAEPLVSAPAGGSEIAFSEDDVDGLFQKWQSLGVVMAQPPTDMDFGRTFVALDPDGHRLRVFRLATNDA